MRYNPELVTENMSEVQVFIFERRTSEGAAGEQEGEQQFSYLPWPLSSSAKGHRGFLLTVLNVRASPQIT